LPSILQNSFFRGPGCLGLIAFLRLRIISEDAERLVTAPQESNYLGHAFVDASGNLFSCEDKKQCFLLQTFKFTAQKAFWPIS
jgi:hypothetical protein